MSEPIPASINACCKLWHVNSGEFTRDEDAPHWGAFWEPLNVNLPESARPSCCYGRDIIFYDRTGNKLLVDHVRHYDFMGPHPHLLYVGDAWREVVSGRVEYRDGNWYMRWAVATNTRFALLANKAQSEPTSEEIMSFIRDISCNYDCDDDAHKYGTTCRACEAKALLFALNATESP